MAKSTGSREPLSAQIFTLKFTILPQIPGPWLQTTPLPTITSWQWPWAAIFTLAEATPPLIKPIATIQALTPGTTLQSPIYLRAARLPHQEPTTAGGYLQEATSTSPLATA